jgi:O-acetylhomoserine (thiol)-lyase
MAAVTSTLLNLVKQGDNIVSSNALFGNTFSLLKNTFRNFGVEARFVDICDLDAIENAIDENTRGVFFETIANPKMSVPDIARVVDISHKRRVAVIVDSTLTTPFLFRGKEIGVDLVVHSSTKLISGGGTGIGGVIVDLGNFDWSDYPSLEKHKKLGELAFVARLRKEIHKNMGVCMAPQIAYLHSLGLETLSLRVEKACENALNIARYLRDNKKVADVNYPGLSSSVFHELAKKQFDNRFGSVLVFRLADKETCFRFLNHLKIIKRATNLGDNTSLIIHPASTIFIDCTAEEKEMMGAGEGMIRLSVGIENVEDLTGDIQQAFDAM